jgi:hypothetical protein
MLMWLQRGIIHIYGSKILRTSSDYFRAAFSYKNLLFDCLLIIYTSVS